MGRNILYNTQMSMYDKQTNKLTPESDGNINMMRNTIIEWNKYFPDDMFHILLPSEVKSQLSSIMPNGTTYAAPIFYDSYVVSARVNRYNFPMNELSSIIREKNLKFDLLINDVIEISGNFKQMFNINFGYIPKIISNIRHTDESRKSDYIYRVIDGMKNSDITTILSESMIPRLVEQMYNAGLDGRYINGMFDKYRLTPFEPSMSSHSLYKYTRMAKEIDLNKAIITFPGRLSPGEEKRTNWDKFQEAILMLREERQDFEIYLTDPNNSMTSELKENLVDWVYTIPKDRDIFLKLLNRTDIITSLMSVEGFGGISIREALVFGCLPVIPNVDEYKKMAPENYPGFVDMPVTADGIKDSLNWAINFVKHVRGKKIHTYEDYGSQFSVEEQFKKLLPLIKEAL